MMRLVMGMVLRPKGPIRRLSKAAYLLLLLTDYYRCLLLKSISNFELHRMDAFVINIIA